jgi:putative Ca2+/H+ antiporter (TMEM165/GDT1 family)
LTEGHALVDFGVALSTFALLFLAEMGDKTQIIAMTLSHRYRMAPVIFGTFTAFVLLNLLAVVVGDGIARVLPQGIVLLSAGVLFLVFAYHSWTAADVSDNRGVETNRRRVWIVSFSLIFVAELGDKTQLAMVALAAQTGELWSVFVGGTLALWSVSLLGIVVGRKLLRRIPAHWVHKTAAILFLAFGLIALVGAVLEWGDVEHAFS